MDEVQKREYDFFMRMAALARQKAVEFAPFRDDPGPAGKLFKQYLRDYENCEFYAARIAEGFVFTHRDSLPPVPERQPVDESKIPAKYRL